MCLHEALDNFEFALSDSVLKGLLGGGGVGFSKANAWRREKMRIFLKDPIQHGHTFILNQRYRRVNNPERGSRKEKFVEAEVHEMKVLELMNSAEVICCSIEEDKGAMRSRISFTSSSLSWGRVVISFLSIESCKPRNFTNGGNTSALATTSQSAQST